MSLSSENETEKEVVEMLAEEGLNATPDAVAEIASQKDPESTVRRLAASCDAVVVTREDARRATDTDATDNDTGSVANTEQKPSTDPPDRPASVESDGSETSNTISSENEPENDEPDSLGSHWPSVTSSASSPSPGPVWPGWSPA